MTLDEALKYAPLASALIGCVAAIIAAVSATFAAVQMRLSRRTAVLQVLQAFDKSASEREAALASASTVAEHDHAFNELMNFLELYAGICNRKPVTGLARELISDRLIDSVVVIERAERWKEIDQAVFHENTFAELKTFSKRNKTQLQMRRLAAEKRAKHAETTPPTRAT